MKSHVKSSGPSLTRLSPCAILSRLSGRQFVTILSINKTRDEDKICLFCRARSVMGALLFLSEEVT